MARKFTRHQRNLRMQLRRAPWSGRKCLKRAHVSRAINAEVSAVDLARTRFIRVAIDNQIGAFYSSLVNGAPNVS